MIVLNLIIKTLQTPVGYEKENDSIDSLTSFYVN